MIKKGKVVLGVVEEITVHSKKTKKVMARIDTGATKSSIDETLAEQLGLGPVIGKRLVKSAHGSKERPFIDVTITIGGKKTTNHFTLINRNHMKYSVLIGRNILRQGFLIDPEKKC
jgi:hypothetical protein